MCINGLVKIINIAGLPLCTRLQMLGMRGVCALDRSRPLVSFLSITVGHDCERRGMITHAPLYRCHKHFEGDMASNFTDSSVILLNLEYDY